MALLRTKLCGGAGGEQPIFRIVRVDSDACRAGVCKKVGDFSSPLSDRLSERNFGLYVFHYVPLAACAYLLHRHTALSAVPSYLLTGLAAFGGGYLLNAVISKIPVLRWCVLGIKRKKKE